MFQEIMSQLRGGATFVTPQIKVGRYNDIDYSFKLTNRTTNETRRVPYELTEGFIQGYLKDSNPFEIA